MLPSPHRQHTRVFPIGTRSTPDSMRKPAPQNRGKAQPGPRIRWCLSPLCPGGNRGCVAAPTEPRCSAQKSRGSGPPAASSVPHGVVGAPPADDGAASLQRGRRWGARQATAAPREHRQELPSSLPTSPSPPQSFASAEGASPPGLRSCVSECLFRQAVALVSLSHLYLWRLVCVLCICLWLICAFVVSISSRLQAKLLGRGHTCFESVVSETGK